MIVLVAEVPTGWKPNLLQIVEQVAEGVIPINTYIPVKLIEPGHAVQLWDNLVKAGRIEIPETINGEMTWRPLRGFPYRLRPETKTNGRRIVLPSEL